MGSIVYAQGPAMVPARIDRRQVRTGPRARACLDVVARA